jgi:hypothetical protein
MYQIIIIKVYQAVIIKVYQVVFINKWGSSIVLQRKHIKNIQINSLTLGVSYKRLQSNLKEMQIHWHGILI